MTKYSIFTLIMLVIALICFQCKPREATVELSPAEKLLSKYTTVKLDADLSTLTDKERQMIPLLIEASKIMDELFWKQAYGGKGALMASINDPNIKKFVEINYGPWDRLDGNKPFMEGFGDKPKGANFYPVDMTKEEFDSVVAKVKIHKQFKDLYTLITRGDKGELKPVPYSEAFKSELQSAADYLRRAAELAEDPGLKNYLTLRATALVTDRYQASDMAWMDMKNNTIDVVIGPIENYEDQMFGYKAAFEAFVLIKDKEWSKRLEKYAKLLPDLQRGLPVPEKYKREKPGMDSDLNAYDVIYYAGDCNAGSKTIAINLPNDEEVQLKKGARRLQLKNSMRAKFEKILTPISNILITDDQQKHITFDAFFANTMFHEVAHGLGIKNTITGKGTARDALKELYSAIEEGKADILGLYMITKLNEQGEFGDADLRDNYVTFLAGIFRSIRFGTASAHGKANLIRFNYFKKEGAFVKDEVTGKYSADFEKMQSAMNSLSEKILKFQGDGDYDGLKAFITEMTVMDPVLTKDLSKLATAGIPVDIVFEQGLEILNINK